MKAKGFTLAEVLIALSVLAISLMAGFRASGAMTQNAERQWQMLLAQMCVDNTLTAITLMNRYPDIGVQQLSCPQAELPLRVTQSILSTPNPSFRRVDVQVFNDNIPLMRVSALISRY